MRKGSRVEITNNGWQYPYYSDWFETNNFNDLSKDFIKDNIYQAGDTGIIVEIAMHEDRDWLIAAIKMDKDSNICLMKFDKDCLKEVKTMENLVYVKFKNSDTKYLYSVPEGVSLAKGEKVYVQTKTSKTPVMVDCVTDSFQVPIEVANILSKECTGWDVSNLSPVLGRAEITYTMKPFN